MACVAPGERRERWATGRSSREAEPSGSRERRRRDRAESASRGPAYLLPDHVPRPVPDANVTLRPADDVAYVESLLSRAGLPTADLCEPSVRLRVAVADGDRVGAGGVEVCGESALLRSLVVDPAARGEGVGSAVCAALEAEARDAGARAAYLLTTTAAEFFEARGYDRVARDDVPPAVAETSEFETLCPAAAVAMRRSL